MRGDSTWATPAGAGWITSAKSAYFTVLTTENNYVFNVTAGNAGVVCTLPSAASAGDGFEIHVCKVDSSKGNVTFAGTGAPTRVLYFRHDTLRLRSDGTNWQIVGLESLVCEDNVWGDGSDGDVTVSGSVTFTRTMHYNSLTVQSGAAINPAGYWLLCKSYLDLTSAPAGWLSTVGAVGGSATGTNQSTGGTAGSGSGRLLGGQVNIPYAGANGGTGAGAMPSSTSANSIIGTISGTATAAQGGAGGAGSGGAGGAARASTTATLLFRLPSYLTDCFLSLNSALSPILMGGNSGQSGSAGGGDGSNNGGGGGGTGRAAVVIGVRARKAIRGASTAANGIIANGSNGGSGGSPTTGNCGGGGGGAGGSGGGIYFVTGELVGTTASNHLQAKGGDGGAGGTGVGTGANGTGGYSGGGGCIVLGELCSNAWSLSLGADIVANSGTTGGVASEFQVSL